MSCYINGIAVCALTEDNAECKGVLAPIPRVDIRPVLEQ
jgi:hypothetical protein